MIYLYTFGAALAIMLVSLIGALVAGSFTRSWVDRNLPYLVSFAAGVFGVVAYSIAHESLELTNSAALTLGALFGGIVFIHVLSLVIPESHHHHSTNDPEDTHDRESARRILSSDAIHNIADGFLIAPAFVINPVFGLATMLGILVHEAVQEISEFFVLREAGYSVREALTRNFAVSGTVLIGAVGGLFISNNELIVGPLLGFASGAFLYVVFRDLIPSSLEASRANKSWLPHIAAGLLGALLMFGINTLGHTHSNETKVDHDHTHEEHAY